MLNKKNAQVCVYLDACVYMYMYSQTRLKGSSQGTHKNWLLKTVDLLIQVHLHCNLVQGTPKYWLPTTGGPLIQWPLKTSLTIYLFCQPTTCTLDQCSCFILLYIKQKTNKQT